METDPQNIQVNLNWKRSVEGRSLSLYSSPPNPDGQWPKQKGGILFVGGVHGDEPEGIRLAQDLLDWLQKNNKQVVHSWCLIPCLNVDGAHHQQRTNANGVDLNRNFPSHDWTSEIATERYHPGFSPGSEPEVQALVELIKYMGPDLIVHFHSWHPCVIYTGEPGEKASHWIAASTGYESRADIGYPTPGSLGNYGWYDCKSPVICVEAQEDVDLNELWNQFGPGLIKILTSKDWL